MDKVRVLLAATENWNKKYNMPDFAEITDLSIEPGDVRNPYDLVIIDRSLSDSECERLQSAGNAHCVYFTDRVKMSATMKDLYMRKAGRILQVEQIPAFIKNELKYYYPKPYGERYHHSNLEISPFFTGEVTREGNTSCTCRGDFGTFFRQVAFWKNTIPVEADRELDFWLEYEKDGAVELQFVLTRVSRSVKTAEFPVPLIYSEEEMAKGMHLDSVPYETMLFVSIEARGEGELRIKSLHNRYARGKHGYFLPGGERYQTASGEEVFAYFEPGNLKPPLNVYFGGYRTQEGFEGVQMMRGMEHPFLLLSDPRLEGGGLYLGTEEYESLITTILDTHLRRLGFAPQEMILSGIGFGASGALYYSTKRTPSALILGKLILHPGSLAQNERLLRPGRFPQALDIQLSHAGDLSKEGIAKEDAKIRTSLQEAEFADLICRVIYMKDDDYDPEAYEVLCELFKEKGIRVVGKGLMGRHNDNNRLVLGLFQAAYKEVLKQSFQGVEHAGREMDHSLE